MLSYERDDQYFILKLIQFQMQPIRLMLLIINPQKRNLINNPTFGLVSIQDVDLVITAIDNVAPNRKHSSR